MPRPPNDPPPPSLAEAIAVGPPPAGDRWGPSAFTDRRGALARIVIVLAIATMLSTGRLVAMAESLPFGSTRSALLDGTRRLDAEARTLRLDEPERALRRLTGREPRRIDEQVAAPAVTLGPPRPAPPVSARDDLAPPTTTLGADADPTAAGPPTIAAPAPPPSSTTTPASAESPEGPTDPTIRVVDPARRLRLWAGGDSLGEYVGNQLLHPLTDPELVEVELGYHISTGLARPDYFDWPGRLAEVMAGDEPPEAVVFMVGGNDDQDMQRSGEVIGVGSPDWYDEYETRVHTVMDIVDNGSTRLLWIGLPPMRDGRRDEIARHVNDILRTAAEGRPHVTMIDIETLFTGPGGDYSPNIAAPNGELRLARAPDGVHVTYTGSTWIAERVVAEIDRNWLFAPELTQPGSATRPTLDLPG